MLKVPSIGLAEGGAGGGSIVWIDAGASLQVGPRSSGALPGPLCYDLGGMEPTVTDAIVILGHLNSSYLVGGAVRLNAETARQALADKIATPLGLSLVQAAYVPHQLAASMLFLAVHQV